MYFFFRSDYDGRTALHLAAAEGHFDCVQFLLEHCNVPHNAKDRWGNTPFDEAETFGHEKVADYIKSYDGKPDRPTPIRPVIDAPAFTTPKDVRTFQYRDQD